MKNAILIILVLFITNSVNAQFSFGVKPGAGLNGAYFGFKTHSLVVFTSFDYIHVGGVLEESGQRFDYNLNQLVTFSDELEAAFSIYNIGVGAKYFLPVTNNISPYFTTTITKPFLSADAKENGATQDDLSDFVGEISIWGVSLGFGTEYFFSENFSVGGEFGLRMFLGSYEKHEKVETWVFNPNTGGSIVQTDRNLEANINFSLTYSVVSLNYYF
jgi:hypothetical protein